MKNTLSFLAVILLVSFTEAQVQTADQILQKHIEAIGGQELIKDIKSQVMHADITVMGNTLPSEMTVLIGKGFKTEVNFQGQSIIQVATPTGGWILNPLQGMTQAQPLPDDQLKTMQSAYESGGGLYNYKEKGSRLELAGNENIDGVNSHKLRLTDKDGKEIFYFIDPSTYYLLKQETTLSVNGQETNSVMTFSNFQKTDIGLVIPYTFITNQGFEVTVNLKKVEFNKDIDLKIFDMP
jgi:outer membrane lipoprotein-sorting protein